MPIVQYPTSDHIQKQEYLWKSIRMGQTYTTHIQIVLLGLAHSLWFALQFSCQNKVIISSPLSSDAPF